ncbi:hypothetical protein F4813DRAFT_396910 [Daldinia decipiens]|uniref:uncharacterized protein n=1 Tax=Daldinia decipiens TaxID=326647 RepID=UPI0020C407D9|nr:uncharacterized protein F4813DRAFT_396910 [Daldinia decipiens]KAI1662237.1 hypothetical protein F4813DRAFT_396910 [Daldinia decipiens]
MENKSLAPTLAATANELVDENQQRPFQSASTNEEHNDPPSTEASASLPKDLKSEQSLPDPKIDTTRLNLVSEVKRLEKELRQKLKMLDSVEQYSGLDSVNQLPEVKDEKGLGSQTGTTSENLDKTIRKLIKRARFVQKSGEKVEEESNREKPPPHKRSLNFGIGTWTYKWTIFLRAELFQHQHLSGQSIPVGLAHQTNGTRQIAKNGALIRPQSLKTSATSKRDYERISSGSWTVLRPRERAISEAYEEER